MRIENELIAEFMGIQKCTDPSHIVDPCFSFPEGYLKREALMYHTSWNWLMPVVERIEIENDKFTYNTPYNESFNGTINTDIKVAYQVVVEFIKWYNANK